MTSSPCSHCKEVGRRFVSSTDPNTCFSRCPHWDGPHWRLTSALQRSLTLPSCRGSRYCTDRRCGNFQRDVKGRQGVFGRHRVALSVMGASPANSLPRWTSAELTGKLLLSGNVVAAGSKINMRVKPWLFKPLRCDHLFGLVFLQKSRKMTEWAEMCFREGCTHNHLLPRPSTSIYISLLADNEYQFQYSIIPLSVLSYIWEGGL